MSDRSQRITLLPYHSLLRVSVANSEVIDFEALLSSRRNAHDEYAGVGSAMLRLVTSTTAQHSTSASALTFETDGSVIQP